MPSSDYFFGTRNSQAVLKHGLMARYAYYFAGRAGKATQGRVSFIDGYAGTGRYEDGNLGSPLLLASEAERAKLMQRRIRLAFVEPNASYRERLRRSLSDAGIEPDVVEARSLQDAADGLLDRYSNTAVFLFVDPFGLAFDYDVLVRILKQRSAWRPLDVLYHFSLTSVARMAAEARRRDTGGESKNASMLDVTLGPIGWRNVFDQVGTEYAKATEAAVEVARRFAGLIEHETGTKSLSIPVRQRPNHVPKYLLTLFSGDQSGRALWDFADMAGKAYVDWLLHCDTEDFEANMRARQSRREQDLQLALFEDEPPEPPRAERIEQQIEIEAQRYLPDRLADLFYRGPRRLVDDPAAAYGDMLGRARLPHIRKAVRTLAVQSRIDDDGKRDFWLRTIRATPNRP